MNNKSKSLLSKTTLITRRNLMAFKDRGIKIE
jgi:hypothetical protein